MIHVKSISKVKYNEHDEVIAIVRSMKNPNPNIRQMQALSPSWDLFGWYRQTKSDGMWDIDAFRDGYTPRFLKEMTADEPTAMLNELYRRSKAGENIALVCFCPDETLCHRSIVAGLLAGAGAEVEMEFHEPEIRYFEEWNRIVQGR